MISLVAGGLGSVSSSNSIKVEVLNNVKCGSYNITTVKAKKVADLNSWLTANELDNFPDEAEKIIEGYIAKNWVFVAIRLRRGEKGNNTPHPIKIGFKTDQAVYPMQLTALAGGAPYFELYTIADHRLSHPLLDTEFSDKFNLNKYNKSKLGFYISAQKQLIIGPEEICSLMWDDCWVSKLSGEVSAEDMTHDFFFDDSQTDTTFLKAYTAWGAFQYAAAWCVPLMTMLGFIYIAYIKSRPKRTTKGHHPHFRKFVILNAIIVLIGTVIYLQLDPVYDVESRHEIIHEISMMQSNNQLKIMLLDFGKKEIDFTQSEAEIRAQFDKKFKDLKFESRKASPKQEASPGNYTIHKTESGDLLIKIYDQYGRARPTTLPYRNRAKDYAQEILNS